MQENSASAPECGTAGLANLLLSRYQEQLIQHRLQEEQEREEGAQEEDEDEESDGTRGWGVKHPPRLFRISFHHSFVIMWPSVSAADDVERQQGEQPTPEEKVLLREEFITQMHQRFLDGKDKDFDYTLVTPPLIALSYCIEDVFVLLRHNKNKNFKWLE